MIKIDTLCYNAVKMYLFSENEVYISPYNDIDIIAGQVRKLFNIILHQFFILMMRFIF